MVRVDRHGPGRALLRPVRHRPRASSAGDAGALNLAVIGLYVVAAVARLRRLPPGRHAWSARWARAFLRDLRIRVFDHLQRLSMPFYDREKAGRPGVAHDLRRGRRWPSWSRSGLLMFVMNTLLLVFSVIVLGASCRGSCCWSAWSRCRSSSLASIRFQRESNQAYLDGPRPDRHTLSRLQEGITGVRVIQAFGREDIEIEPVRGARTATSTTPTCDSVRVQAWYLPVIEFAGLGTTAAGRRHRRLDGHRRRRHHRHGRLLRAHAGQPVRARSSSSASCSTRCSRPAPG